LAALETVPDAERSLFFRELEHRAGQLKSPSAEVQLG
jgi:hypothetical protein